jgi:hypothetical protein
MNRPRLEDFFSALKAEDPEPGDAFLDRALSAAYAAQPQPVPAPAGPAGPAARPAPRPAPRAVWGFGLGLLASLFAGFWVGYGDPLGLGSSVLPDVSGSIAALDASVDFSLPVEES